MKVRVYNDNPHTDWEETFKGDKVFIPKGGFIEMEFYEAHEFKGQYYPIKLLPDETQDKKSFKMIRVEKVTQEELDADQEGMEVFQCNACRRIFTTEKLLLKHSDTEHADMVTTDPAAEKEAVRKRGRPAKAKTEEQANT